MTDTDRATLADILAQAAQWADSLAGVARTAGDVDAVARYVERRDTARRLAATFTD